MAQLPFRCAFSSGLYHARLSIHSSFDRWKDVYVNNNKKKIKIFGIFRSNSKEEN